MTRFFTEAGSFTVELFIIGIPWRIFTSLSPLYNINVFLQFWVERQWGVTSRCIANKSSRQSAASWYVHNPGKEKYWSSNVLTNEFDDIEHTRSVFGSDGTGKKPKKH